MRINKTNVESLKAPVPVPPATRAQTFYRDDKLQGFAVRVTNSGVKSFVVETKVNGATRRATLGKFPRLTAELARSLAEERLGAIASGRDPDAEKRTAKAKAVTLSEAFVDMLAARTLKPRSIYDYRRVMAVAFPDWQKRALVAITKDAVERRHRLLGDQHGEAYANLALRVLRATLNYAAARYEDAAGRSILPENPVKRLSATRAWYVVERRQTIIREYQISAWWAAVDALESRTVADYLKLLVLTGLRRNEAASLAWDNIDLRECTLTVPDTKNHRPQILPLGDYLADLLTQRRKDLPGATFVFPAATGSGHLVEPRKSLEKVTAHSGVPFTIHDLRRTFITIAEGLDIPAYALKRLLNHKDGADVTGGYIVTDTARLRRPVQQIEDFILKAAGVKPTAEVVPLVRNS